MRFSFAGYQGKMAQNGHYTTLFLGDPEIDFVKLAEAQGIAGEMAMDSAGLAGALQRGLTATREGRPYLIDARIRRIAQGSDSTWHRKFSLAKSRKRST